MVNPILQMLGEKPQQTPNNLNQIKNITQMMRNSKNPKNTLNILLAQNPQMQQVMDYVNQNGGNAQEAFYKLAKERGVNPEDVLSLFK